MKKILFLLLSLTLILALTACGKKVETKNNTQTENEMNLVDEENVSENEFVDPFANYSSEFLNSDEGMIFQNSYHYYRANSEWIDADNDFEVKNVTNPRVRIYTPEEIAANSELFESHNIKEGDIPFEITVDLEISENSTDLMKFTAGTGEIDGNTIKDKFQCGIARKVDDGYEFDYIGTSF